MARYTAEDVIKNASDEVVEIFNGLRYMILERIPEVEEQAIPAAKSVHYLIRGKDFIAGPILAVGPGSTFVTLYFVNGDVLPDPDGLTRGSGGRRRMIRFENPDMIHHPAVRALLEAAREERRKKSA